MGLCCIPLGSIVRLNVRALAERLLMRHGHECRRLIDPLGREAPMLIQLGRGGALLGEVGVQLLVVVEEAISVVQIGLAEAFELLQALAVILLGLVASLRLHELHLLRRGRHLRDVGAPRCDPLLLHVWVPLDLVSGQVVARVRKRSMWILDGRFDCLQHI